MEEPVDSNKCKGKSVASNADEALACPRCSRTFTTVNGLCAHQSSHRFVKEPTKISPILAAVINNPPPPNDKPELVIPRGRRVIPMTKDPDAVPKQKQKQKQQRRRRRRPTTNQAGHEKDGNRELIQDNFALIEAINDDEKKKKKTTWTKKKAEGESDKVPVKQKKQVIDLNKKPPEYSQVYADNSQVTYCQNQRGDRVTADLLREWRPMTAGFGSEIFYSRARYGAGSSRTRSNPVDLELKLGLGNCC